MSRFQGLDPARFLAEYWQKRPLLLKGALPAFHDPLSPEELAGLACEEPVESRLVQRRQGRWQSRQGPFTERDFLKLPERDWTVLVQNVDRWVPEVRALLDLVDFLPRWRVDDVLVSYAAQDGGVGPHFDWYDVFILQGQGRRRWRIGQHCDSTTPLDTRSGLKILENFETVEDWLLEPGDLMYIPPGVAHWGEALEAGLSYSIGFRAPSLRELVFGVGDLVGEGLADDRRYGDADLSPLEKGSAISAAALDRAQALLRAALEDRRSLALWLGRDATEQREEALPELPEEALDEAGLQTLLASGEILCVNPVSRVAYSELDGELLLFADGEALSLPRPSVLADLALRIGQAPAGAPLLLGERDREADCLSLLAALYDRACLILLDPDEVEIP